MKVSKTIEVVDRHLKQQGVMVQCLKMICSLQHLQQTESSEHIYGHKCFNPPCAGPVFNQVQLLPIKYDFWIKHVLARLYYIRKWTFQKLSQIDCDHTMNIEMVVLQLQTKKVVSLYISLLCSKLLPNHGIIIESIVEVPCMMARVSFCNGKKKPLIMQL